MPPEPGHARAEGPLALDVVNPHHGDYYTKGGGGDRKPPLESDAPIPTHRLTVRPGTSFLVRVEASDNSALSPWLDWVVDTLVLPALDWEGIGTRTTSGYGRLVEVDPAGAPKKGRAWDTTAKAETEGGRDVVQVTRTRNDGALHATLPNGKVASLRGPRAREIYLGFSDTVRGRIDRNKPVRLQVTWTKAGNLLSIEDIQENP